MKSPMVEEAEWIAPDQKGGYGPLEVLRSPAGYYIGTIYTDPDDGCQEPGSRDSDYFPTREDAERYLRIVEGGFGAPTRLTP